MLGKFRQVTEPVVDDPERTRIFAGFVRATALGYQYFHVSCGIRCGYSSSELEVLEKWPENKCCTGCGHAGGHRPPSGQSRWLWRLENKVINNVHKFFHWIGG